MMSKERLEEKINFSDLPFEKRIKLTKESIQKDLKASDYLFPKNVYINTKYILEIIEQAELVSKHETRINNLTFDLASSRVQNKRYREVIKKAIDDLENECLWDALVALKELEENNELR